MLADQQRCLVCVIHSERIEQARQILSVLISLPRPSRRAGTAVCNCPPWR
jgi:hypothetical protein